MIFALGFGLILAAANGRLDFDFEAVGYGLGLAALIVFPVAMLMALVGLILGVRALVKSEPRRGAAIAGLVMSTLCLLPSILLIVYVASINGGVDLAR